MPKAFPLEFRRDVVAVHTSAAKQTEVARAVRARVRTAFERGSGPATDFEA